MSVTVLLRISLRVVHPIQDFRNIFRQKTKNIRTKNIADILKLKMFKIDDLVLSAHLMFGVVLNERLGGELTETGARG